MASMNTTVGKMLARLAPPALGLMLLTTGCKSNQAAPSPAPIQDASNAAATDPNADPAAANLCPAGPLTSAPAGSAPATPARVLGARTEAPAYTQQGENYPAPQQQSQGAYQGPDNPNSPAYDNGYQTDVDAGQDALYAPQAPPPLPVYEQPPAPDPNDQWTPGYWNYGSAGYYWVPGVWVAAPYTGALWTPPYWGFYGGRYGFHRGYWGLHIGFYGGVPYGFGYTGLGYEGGYWRGNEFYYNRAVNRINPNIHNVYVHNVTVINNYNRVSYNGGPGGIAVRPRPSEVLAFREQHTPPMQTQLAVAHEASVNRAQFYNVNHGQPQQIARPQPVAAVRGIQPPPRVNYNQGALANEPQRNENLQQRNQNEQLHNQNLQQRNQNEQLRNQNEQQRNMQEQQRNVQLQQHNQQTQAQQQQRNMQEQQRNVQEQQRNQQEQQRNQQLQQRNQAEQQRAVQQQQRQAAAPRPQAAPQPRPQPEAQQPRPQAATPQPRAQPEPRAAPAPRPAPPAPHAAAPAPHPAPAPHEENGHPRR